MPINLETHHDIKFLKIYNLMSDLRIRTLVKERKLFMQKNATEEITKEECLKLLTVELDVMSKCVSAIDKYYIPQTWFITESLNVMKLLCNRIDHLYYSMFQMFSIGCVLLVNYMEFHSNNIEFITNENPPLIVLMSRKKCEPQMYIAAATFEYEKKNIEMARRYFEEGIIKYANNKTLYLEQLWIEVMYFDDVGGGDLNEIKPIEIYKKTIKKFEYDMEFHIVLLERSIEVKPLWRLQHEIVCDLMEMYNYSDIMWHKVATLCTNGYVFNRDTGIFGYVTDPNKRARCCIKTYNKGLKHVFNVTRKLNLMKLLTEYIIKLWKYYNTKINSEFNKWIQKEMKKAFQMGHFDLGGLHEPEYYVYWAVLSEEIHPEILQLAIDCNKGNVGVWAEALNYRIEHFGSYRTVKKIFDAGNQALGNKSLLLWKKMETFLKRCRENDRQLGKFYKDGAKSPYQEISNVYKVKHLEWVNDNDGISSARGLFNQMIRLVPAKKKLYMNMIQYEKMQKPINICSIRSIYNLACHKFSSDVPLLADCLEFELEHIGKSTADRMYDMALMNLQPQLRTDLKHMYEMRKETHRNRPIIIDPDIIIIPDDEE
ncbi:U3 small nucleolar RNA-associated protein 6 homolog [Acyrthosiphon pisum]|uniref:U3 small nucleolar RNA-associated protein 6 homolog C-terminal domain-containing protein n=1 Tax=Acyrthosiphon pisum TaxID=7029 RepID=A0A8R2A9M5_ACYPI|nr:U3 small nucleolar RNA-associated protein 6 homolog [Acyrthosiphon pisum]|eukprot:XP_003244622.2 PREDICTED: U3 small nucleolar RNA-associated protein 6 homolog [Acyrthosiphon pisum]